MGILGTWLIEKSATKKETKIEPKNEPEKSLIAFLNIGNCRNELHNDWFIDSGATGHICNREEYFDAINKTQTEKEVLVANNSRVKVMGIGNVWLNINNKRIMLKKVNFVPEMCANLISVRRITESGHEVSFMQGKCKVINKMGETILEGKLNDGMYKVQANPEINIERI